MKNAKGILILLLIFVGVPFALLALIWKDRCQRTSLHAAESPDGRFVAVTERVDCGPSMKVASEVTLSESNGKGAQSVLVVAEEKGLETTWEDAGRLTLRLPPNAEVVKSVRSYQGVTISVLGPVR